MVAVDHQCHLSNCKLTRNPEMHLYLGSLTFTQRLVEIEYYLDSSHRQILSTLHNLGKHSVVILRGEDLPLTADILETCLYYVSSIKFHC